MISFEDVELYNLQAMREAIKRVGDTCGFDYPYFEVSRDFFVPTPAFSENGTMLTSLHIFRALSIRSLSKILVAFVK